MFGTSNIIPRYGCSILEQLGTDNPVSLNKCNGWHLFGFLFVDNGVYQQVIVIRVGGIPELEGGRSVGFLMYWCNVVSQTPPTVSKLSNCYT